MATIQNKYRYTLTDRTGATIVAPLGEDKLQVSWEKEDDNKADYEAKLEGKVTFTKEAYERLFSLEKTIYRCSQITLKIDRLDCNGNWEFLFSGEVKLNKGDWDLDNCTVDISVDSYDAYNCLEIGLDEEINLLSIVSRYATTLIDNRIVIEYQNYDSTDCSQLSYWYGAEPAENGKWGLIGYNQYRNTEFSQTCNGTSFWARETLTVPTGTPVDSSWAFMSTSGGNTKYARYPRITNIKYTYPPNYETGTYSMTSDVIGASGTNVKRITNGVYLGDVLDRFVTQGCPTYKVVSNFFDINADPNPGAQPVFSEQANIITTGTTTKTVIIQNSASASYVKAGSVLWFNNVYYRVIVASAQQVNASPLRYNITAVLSSQPPMGTYNTTYRVYGQQTSVNYVTGQASNTSGILVFQKSDVKRPTAPNKATKMLISGKDFLDRLITMFNLEYRVQDGVFRIEHVSWFQKPSGIDTTAIDIRKHVRRSRKYTYDNESLPGKEVFKFMEQINADFVGRPITYNSECVTRETKKQTVEHFLDDITTDVEFVMLNPDPESKSVSDDGIVLVSAVRPASGDWVINTTAGIFDQPRLNNPFSWAHLHNSYHRHKRPFRTGVMNDVQTTFASVIPTKKAEKITIPMCCNLKFDPFATVKTELGIGIVNKATYSLKNKTIELDLNYVADDGLITNAAPVAKSFEAFTFLNSPVYIPLTGAFTDADNDAVTPFLDTPLPVNGVASLVTYGGIPNYLYYVPNNGFSGSDYVFFRGIDPFGEQSNRAYVKITIRSANQSPVANSETYQVDINKPLIVATAQGLLVNDTDDYTKNTEMAVISNTNPAHGTVSVNRDGSFTYTPSINYTGSDAFTYTIQDGAGLTAIGIVSLIVRNLNGPRVAPDSYGFGMAAQTSINSATGVLVNDYNYQGLKTGLRIYSPNGTYPVTYTTASGNTVQMDYDGAFRYNRSAQFTGVDTFSYTATDNSNTTNSATVTIRVFPKIYVKMVVSDFKDTGPMTAACGPQGYTLTTWLQTRDYTFYFYSNPQGTVPVDVSQYGLILSLRQRQFNVQTGQEYYYNYTLNVPSTVTTSYKAYDDTQAYIKETECSNLDDPWATPRIEQYYDIFLDNGSTYDAI